MASVEAQAPVMPARLRAQYDVSPEEMRVTFRPRSWGVAAFLALWLTGWTVGCVVLAGAAIADPKLATIAFGIPFWVAWLFVAAILIGAVTRRQQLQVDDKGLLYFDWAVVRLATRWIPRDEFRGFEVGQNPTSRNDSDSTPQSGLSIRTAGKPLFIFGGLPEPELRWLAWQLSQLVGSAYDSAPPEIASAVDDSPAVETTVNSLAPPGGLESLGETLSLAEEALPPPSDCSWERSEDFSALAFQQRGRWQWSAVLGLLFVASFWNGIVSVFVMLLVGLMPGGPRGGEWWFLFFFLIPFEAIGLALLAALVFAMLEPVRRTTWRFDTQQVEHQLKWLGIGMRRVYPITVLASIRLTRQAESRKSNDGKKARAAAGGVQWPNEGSQFGLSLVQPPNIELCEIRPLTEGEARWMADSVLRERPQCFR